MIFHFKFLLANLRRGKGGFFIVGPSKHLASLRHCEQAHGMCKALIGSFSLIVPLIVLFITPSHFQKYLSTQLEKYLCQNNITGWANNLNFSKEFTQNYEIQNDLIFSDVFAPEFDDCTTNLSQIRESCSGDWLLATTYVLWVIQEQAWVWIINATKQCKCDAAPIACKVFCKEINPRHLRIFSPVNCKWKLTGEIMEEFSKKCLMINCSFRFRKQIWDSRISLSFSKSPKNFQFRHFFIRFWKLRKIQPAVTYWLIATAYMLQIIPENLQWK